MTVEVVSYVGVGREARVMTLPVGEGVYSCNISIKKDVCVERPCDGTKEKRIFPF